jgi:hypothetical protein
VIGPKKSLLFFFVRDTVMKIKQGRSQMASITFTAAYRYFSFTSYYFGKAFSGLAEMA